MGAKLLAGQSQRLVGSNDQYRVRAELLPIAEHELRGRSGGQRHLLLDGSGGALRLSLLPDSDRTDRASSDCPAGDRFERGIRYLAGEQRGGRSTKRGADTHESSLLATGLDLRQLRLRRGDVLLQCQRLQLAGE